MLTITKTNFQTEVKNSNKPVLLDFWAIWCGPCKMFAPVLEQYAASHPEIKVGKVNVDDEPELAEQHRVMSIPFLVLYQNGQVKKTAIGAKSLAQLEAWMQ